MIRLELCSRTVLGLTVALLVAGCGSTSKSKSRSIVGSDAANSATSTTSTTSDTGTTTGGASAKDVVPPNTSIVSSPSALTNTNSATFRFSSASGSTFACDLDAGGYVSCPNPQKYFGLPDGPHIFGVRAVDAAGNVDASPATRIWTVDTTPPNTTIVSGTSGPVSSTAASFTFSGTDTIGVDHYKCKLDTGSWTTCISSQNYTGLPGGAHTFSVRAVDAAGNVDATPATSNWTVDTTPPDTSIVSSPSSLTHSSSASFKFSTVGGSTFECDLDAGGYVSCPNPQNYSGLADGLHTFSVRAIDAAGNTDASPATRTWTVDATPPDTSIVSSPSSLTYSSSASFQFSTVGGSTFECDLDGGGYALCTHPKSYTGLADGSHTFSVRAIDAAGNTDASPATRTWTVDTTPPNTTITSGASGAVSSTSNSFVFTCNESSCSYQCAVNGGAFAGCSNPYGFFVGQADGSYTLQVRAIDAAGNVAPTPVTAAWTVDTVPPIVTISSGPASVTDVTTSTSAHFVFGCNESECTTYCSMDGVTATTCTNPVDYTALTPGSYTFAITGVDLAGNATTSVASQTWTVSIWRSIPGGTFSMGDALDGESDAPVHSVTFSTFEMMSVDVTNGAYAECVAAGSCTVPGTLTSYSGRNPYYGSTTYADYPVIYVNWNQAKTYCTWAGVRLPTEVEWEYAARGGLSGQRFPWGDTIDCSKANYYADPSYTYDTNSSKGACSGIGTDGDTTQVGSYAANGYGLYDMAGNVWDWVNDWYGPYPSNPVTADPQGPATGSDRVIRGGGFLSDAGSVRVANRHNSYPSSQDYTIGFRCVRDYPTDTTISSAPVASTVATQASFELSCNKAVCSYFCSLDNGVWQSCISPVSYSSLSTGAHVLAVTAMSNSGVTDSTPATWNWDIDSKGNLWQSISGGTFTMGDALDAMSNALVHSVTLSAFNMMSYEVTNGTYADCVAAGSCTVPGTLTSSSGRNPYYGNTTYADYPVIYVNRSQAKTYCTWAGGRLPTEAEWEYAARGGLSGQRFPWGDTIDCSKANYSACANPEDTTQVGSYAANGYGLYDMAGNVFDWVNDWYGPYPSNPVTDPQGPATGLYRVFRSGGFSYSAYYVRVAYRGNSSPGGRSNYIGFRCAR